MDNFEELRKKVEAYPNSSLFVPLAEEYKKRGELDEAVNVLKRGLERQPSYTSARVSLAKVYLEKGLRAEAVAELEKVVAVSPDNFFAHKKLAETYCKLGRKDDAITQYNEVLKLNPEDEEASEGLSRLESGDQCDEGQPPEDLAAELESLSMPPEEEAAAPKNQETAPPEDSAFEFPDNDMPVSDSDIEVSMEEAASFDVPGDASGFSGEDEEVWDVDDSDFDMGGLEFEPDGVYGDEDSGEVVEREAEAGLDIGDDSASADDIASGGDSADMGADAEAPPLDEDLSGGADILMAAEKVGHEIFNEPGAGEPQMGRESLVPSGGVAGDVSKEYSGESFIGNDDQNVIVTQAPGLETFEPDEEETKEPPAQDKTVMMREPLAGMYDAPGGSVSGEERTVIMEAPSFDAAPGQDKASAGVSVEPDEDRTVIMMAPDLEDMEAASAAPFQGQDEVVYQSEPFASLDDTRAFKPAAESEALTAEAGTIDEKVLKTDLPPINDPFAGLSVKGHDAPEAEAFEAEVFEVFEAEAVEVEAVDSETVEAETLSAVELEADLSRADGLIASGDFSEARRVYLKLLSVSPANELVKMKMDELSMLLRVTGKGGELYTNRLDSFLAAITRRRDELRENT